MSNETPALPWLDVLAGKSGLTPEQAQKAVQAFLDIVVERTKADGKFIVPGFCKFKIQKRKARRGRLPRTGQAILIPEKSVVKLQTLPKFSDRICPPSNLRVQILAAEPPPAPAVELPPTPAAEPPHAVVESAEQPARSETIELDCPSCGARIEIPSDATVNQYVCPICANGFTVSTGAEQVSPSPSSVDDFIYFRCEQCMQEIEAYASMAGTSTDCPSCGEPLTIPLQSTMAPAAPGGQSSDMHDSTAMGRTLRIELPDEDIGPRKGPLTGASAGAKTEVINYAQPVLKGKKKI